MLVATLVPLTETVAPATGKLFGSVIFPVTVLCCANTTLMKSNKKVLNNTLNEVDLAIIIVDFLFVLVKMVEAIRAQFNKKIITRANFKKKLLIFFMSFLKAAEFNRIGLYYRRLIKLIFCCVRKKYFFYNFSKKNYWQILLMSLYL